MLEQIGVLKQTHKIMNTKNKNVNRYKDEIVLIIIKLFTMIMYYLTLTLLSVFITKIVILRLYIFTL